MNLIISLTLIVALIIAANLITKSAHLRSRRLFDGVLLAVNLPLFMIGVFFVFTSDAQIAQMTGPTGEALFPFISNALTLGMVLQITAVWGIVVSLHATRLHLSQVLPVDPNSSVHTLALVCIGWLVGGTLVQVTQNSVTDIVEGIGPISIPAIVLQQLTFVLLGLLGVGLFTRRDLAQTRERLGIKRMTYRQLWEGVGWVLGLVWIQTLIGSLWALANPEQAELMGDLNRELQSSLDTLGEWAILALASGIGEELLFRGALQPLFGWVPTALLFALVHVQYGFFTPATLTVLIIGLAFGYVRRRHHTTMAVFVHAGYNFVLGLLALLTSYFIP